MDTDRVQDFCAEASERSAQVIQIDNGKHVAAVAFCAIVCGFCAALCWKMSVSFHDDSVDIQDQYQKERNHVIELEARLKVQGDQIQEMSHVRR